MTNNIKITVEELRKLINVDNVIGSPIETEDKILVPVMRMGVGFGIGENLLGKEGSDAAGAGAGVEPISMVMIPKKGNSAEGVRVLDLSKGSDANKALSDLGLIITDLIKKYMDSSNNDYDESEYIEPEFTTKDEEE
ncbi:GerW family sporulation protein [Methanobrevibacter sp.]|uniref:GerW family sporulation protein n=1 Tax=Methanobrevibacter sp. TaxID=66852 RepID=UPI0025DCF16C|nr:spore germination protein GerW family protein [Methanobrevibacter sp.]MBQ2832845.1 sporulation protein [Methanobrevibacter sp.]